MMETAAKTRMGNDTPKTGGEGERGVDHKKEPSFAAIDLKSFYASVECRERGLDPLVTNLVVADEGRTEKTICLAVTPSLKAYGIPGRARLFEVNARVAAVNRQRERAAGHPLQIPSSKDDRLVRQNPNLALTFLIAPPRMNLYMQYSTRIYQIYLKYVAPEDIHVYSIDEVMIDLTSYLNTYRMTARELTKQMILDIYQSTGITATAGLGTNLYLCKVAMDILAKHEEPDEDGVRIAELDELSYRKRLWSHRPITDFWRVGPGLARKLGEKGMHTMGDVARCSIGGPYDTRNEDLLYQMFGINAELLIDHAWGWEPCTMAAIKAYEPEQKSISQGQVLPGPYPAGKGRLIVQEMTDLLALDLVKKGLLTDQVVLTVGYDIENVGSPSFHGELKDDRYGRKVPKSAHGSISLDQPTSSTRKIIEAALTLYDRIVDPSLLVRRMYVVAGHVVTQEEAREAEKKKEPVYEQLSFFDTYEQLSLYTGDGLKAQEARRKKEEEEERKRKEEEDLERERKVQEAVLKVQKKFGKNALLKGMNLQEGATARERNQMVGGHKG